MACKQQMLSGFDSDTEEFRTKMRRHGILGHSSILQDAFLRAFKYAYSESPVLITAETGAGKELCARFIHIEGPRSSGPFVAVNCATITAELFESDLFGHTRGAFTGAHNSRAGYFQRANGGVLFLDEINSLPYVLQPKLLRALQESECNPVGSEAVYKFRVRVIAATNCNLEQMVKAGQFREDLFFRLNVLPLTLPPLRERKEDIPVLASTQIKVLNSRQEKSLSGIWPWRTCQAVGFTANALNKMMEYDWPGNVRELNSRVERAWTICGASEIRQKDLDFTTAPEVANARSFQALWRTV